MSDNYSLLVKAVIEEDLGSLNKLLNRGIDVNEQYPGKAPALVLATETENVDIVQQLIKYGACVDIAAVSKCGNTPLHIAVSCGNTEIIKYLLSNNANVNAKNTNKETPLHLLVLYSDTNCLNKCKEIAELLIRNGTDLKARRYQDDSVLHIAAENGYVELVELLLKYDVDVNAKNLFGRTPLHSAFHTGCEFRDKGKGITAFMRKQIAQLLINGGADIHSTDDNKQTVLHYVSECGNFEAMELLLNYNVDVDARDSWENTPLLNTFFILFYANKFGNEVIVDSCIRRKKIVELLLNKGADINARNANQQTLLLRVIGQSGTNKWYLEKSVSERDSIYFEVLCPCKFILRLLLDTGIDINARDFCGYSVLHYAVMHKYNEVVDVLLDYEADINLERYVDDLDRELRKLSFQNINKYDGKDDWTQSLHGNLVHIFVAHEVRLITLNSFVSEKNLEIFHSSEEMRNFKSECEREIKRMKIKINNTNVTFYELFTKNIHTLAEYMNNHNIVMLLLEYHEMETIFPIYARVIRNRLSRGMKRQMLLSQCMNVMHHFSSKLTYADLVKISASLNDADLKRMISACSFE